MPWTPSKRGTRDQQSRLRALAEQKGYRAEPALMTGHWYLFDGKDQKAKTAAGSLNWKAEGAISFLARLPDAAPPLAPDY